jgi:hypothetical protein
VHVTVNADYDACTSYHLQHIHVYFATLGVGGQHKNCSCCTLVDLNKLSRDAIFQDRFALGEKGMFTGALAPTLRIGLVRHLAATGRLSLRSGGSSINPSIPLQPDAPRYRNHQRIKSRTPSFRNSLSRGGEAIFPSRSQPLPSTPPKRLEPNFTVSTSWQHKTHVLLELIPRRCRLSPAQRRSKRINQTKTP